MVEVKPWKVGTGWDVWINGIRVYGSNSEAVSHRIAASIHPEQWPTAEERELQTLH